jgi:hypothetical protein
LRQIAKGLGVALTVSAIVAPIIIWLVTGPVSLFGAIYGAEALVIFLARSVARSMGLPTWSASESYVRRLRQWQVDRRDSPRDRASRPS